MSHDKAHGQTHTLGQSHASVQHILPIRVYMMVFFALMILTAITVFVANIPLGMFNVPVALGIATVKATLVALFFMHVKYSEKLVSLFLVASIAWLILMLTGTMMDPPFRTKVSTGAGPMDAEAPMPRPKVIRHQAPGAHH
jgi:cytochrome c oxidase subunit IV